MACKRSKPILLTILGQKHVKTDWYVDFEASGFQNSLNSLVREMKRLGVLLSVVQNSETVVTINSYADLLNSVKISSPQDSHINLCVGHIIGKSQNLDIIEDITSAVRRVAFAPETVAPSSEFRKVCHNCGCGC